jgi:hypothetical protein
MSPSHRRCSECRKPFTPEPRTGARQKVCGPICRAARDRKLARRRRRKDVDGHRADERERQLLHRAKARAAPEGANCHAPAAAAKRLELQAKVIQFVDRALRRSRASLLRDLAEIVPRAREFVADTG